MYETFNGQIYQKTERMVEAVPNIKKEFDQTKYQNEYKKKTYDRIELLVPKGQKAVIKERATALGKSLNEFIYSAVKEKMEEKKQLIEKK